MFVLSRTRMAAPSLDKTCHLMLSKFIQMSRSKIQTATWRPERIPNCISFLCIFTYETYRLVLYKKNKTIIRFATDCLQNRFGVINVYRQLITNLIAKIRWQSHDVFYPMARVSFQFETKQFQILGVSSNYITTLEIYIIFTSCASSS